LIESEAESLHTNHSIQIPIASLAYLP
jgi:hypothetical protein